MGPLTSAQIQPSDDKSLRSLWMPLQLYRCVVLRGLACARVRRREWTEQIGSEAVRNVRPGRY
jgi:hypothetical protein